jgi:hypothetical protein
MNYKPRTSSEWNLFHIEKNLKKLKKRTISLSEADLNKRFDRLRKDNPMMWEDLYPEYVETVRMISLLSLN